MQIAARVQHHPSRAALIAPLLERLEGLRDVEVVEDPGGAVPDTWRAHRALLASMPAGATHLLCLQDDALPCARFAVEVEDVVCTRPAEIVCLFTPGFGYLARRTLEARQRRERFMVLPGSAFVPLVAVVYPRAHVDGLLAFTSGEGWPRAPRAPRPGVADDATVAHYVRAHRVRVIATVPSLVEHRTDVRSIARPGHRDGAHRRAAWFAG